MAIKLQWAGLVGGICIGAVLTGGAWEVTHAMTKSGPAIASVGHTTIHRVELDKQLDTTAGNQTLTTMIEQQLIQDAAQKTGIYATDAEINTARQSFEMQNGIASDADLESALSQSGMTLSEFNSELKTEVLAEKVAKHNVKVTNAQIEKYYTANKASFNVPEMATISGIFVKTQAAADSAEASIKQGKSFAAVAKAVSTDATSKAKGGALGQFSKAQLDAATQKVAFTIPLNQVSQPIKTSAGWEIIKVTKLAPAYTKSLAQAKSSIVNTLKQQNAVPITTLLSQLAKSEGISIHNPHYASVKTQIENLGQTAASPSSLG